MQPPLFSDSHIFTFLKVKYEILWFDFVSLLTNLLFKRLQSALKRSRNFVLKVKKLCSEVKKSQEIVFDKYGRHPELTSNRLFIVSYNLLVVFNY